MYEQKILSKLEAVMGIYFYSDEEAKNHLLKVHSDLSEELKSMEIVAKQISENT